MIRYITFFLPYYCRNPVTMGTTIQLHRAQFLFRHTTENPFFFENKKLHFLCFSSFLYILTHVLGTHVC